METDGVPEVRPSGQDLNPIVLNPTLVVPLIDVKSPGDSMVPLDPEESSSEYLVPRTLISNSVILSVVAYTSELARELNTQVQIYVKGKLGKGIEFPTFSPSTLDEARDNLECPPIPEDSLLGTWAERVLSIQQHEENIPSAFKF